MRLRSSTATVIATSILRMLGLAWLMPALAINVDWFGETSLAWNIAAAMSIVASALFIDAAIRVHSWVMTPLFTVVALLLVVNNFQVAFTNLNHTSDRASDHRQSVIDARSQHARTRSQFVARRAEVALIAGEQPPGVVEAEITRTISSDAKRWQATRECDPQHTTLPDSMTFCSAIAELRVKLEAAKKRDSIDVEIAALDDKLVEGEAITSADPYGDAIARVLLAFGFHVPDEVKDALSIQRDVTRALALELVAAFGPSAWWLMVAGFGAVMPKRPSSSRRAPRHAAVSPRESDFDAVDAFVAEALETAAGAHVAAGALWKAWQAFCAENGRSPGAQKPFGQHMKKRFEHQANNGRPRYMNVRIKPRLVAQAAAVC